MAGGDGKNDNNSASEARARSEKVDPWSVGLDESLVTGIKEAVR
ncbi:MAG: hypothetical protein HONDAALG_03462 [Gammaproteobacteria bacterium]|nr:hypothetical protein [Gammaproteobacteria bacterium]